MITKAEVEKLAHLARIELGEAEKEELQKELGSILDFVSKLKKTEVGEIQAGGRIFEETNVFREDVGGQAPEEYSAELIESAPQKESGYLKVKNVFADNGN